jgi:hypothetical protein
MRPNRLRPTPFGALDIYRRSASSSPDKGGMPPESSRVRSMRMPRVARSFWSCIIGGACAEALRIDAALPPRSLRCNRSLPHTLDT